MTPGVHQFVPTLEPGAVGAHTIQLHRLLLEVCGVRSYIFAEHISPAMASSASHYARYARAVRAEQGDVLVYQMAIGSGVADFVRDRPERLIVNHHALTPVEFWGGWEPAATHGVVWGRSQLIELAGHTELGIADSRFNEVELVEVGYPSTVVAPVMVDLDAFDRAVDAGTLASLERTRAGGGSDWLFVGRIAPNKCQHDLVKAFAAYRRLYDPKARLHLVGASSSHAYWTALERFAASLGLSNAVSLTGAVSSGVLAAYLRAADVFVCLSEHEGFCVPLLEAMHHRLPIVAFSAAAVPETLGGAGILLEDKAPVRVAATVHRVITEQPLREALTGAGSERLSEFNLERSRARWLEVLESLGVTTA